MAKRQKTRSLSPDAKAELLIREMELYYKEVQDINARTALYTKLLGFIVLALTSYIFFGMRIAIADEFMKLTVDDKTKHYVGTMTLGYAVIGLSMTALLQFLLYYAIDHFASSRLHKIRYWRSISCLRQHLHRALRLVRSGRGIAMQTGLELSDHRGFSGQVPRPHIRAHEYKFGLFLAFVSTMLFFIPAVFFISGIVLSLAKFDRSLQDVLLRALCVSLPFVCLVACLNLNLAAQYKRTLQSAQFVSPQLLHPEVENRRWKSREKVLVIALRSISWIVVVVCWILLLRVGASTHPSGWLLAGTIGATVTACFERMLSLVLKQWSLHAAGYVMTKKIARLAGRGQNRWFDALMVRILGKKLFRALSREAASCAAVTVKPPTQDWPG